MKKITFIFLTAAFIFFAYHTNAQKLSKKVAFGFGFEGGLVTGDLKDFYGGAGGFTLRLSVHAGHGFATLTSGAVAFIPKNLKDEDNLKAAVQIPIKAGYKYIIVRHLFVMGEIGFSPVTSYSEDDQTGDVLKYKKTGFTYAPSVGVQFGAAEIALRYESTSLDNTSLSMVGLRIGFNF